MRHMAASVVLSVLLASAGCADSEPRYPYPNEMVDNFVSFCVGTAGKEQRSACECMIREMQERIPLIDFVALESSVVSSGSVQPLLSDRRIRDAVEACEGEL